MSEGQDEIKFLFAVAAKKVEEGKEEPDSFMVATGKPFPLPEGEVGDDWLRRFSSWASIATGANMALPARPISGGVIPAGTPMVLERKPDDPEEEVKFRSLFKVRIVWPLDENGAADIERLTCEPFDPESHERGKSFPEAPFASFDTATWTFSFDFRYRKPLKEEDEPEEVSSSETTPRKKRLPSSPLPGEVFGTTTGPASQHGRRAGGGKLYWVEDQGLQVVRTTQIQGQNLRVYAAFQPEGTPPVINWNEPDQAKEQLESFMESAWKDALGMSADEVDWFDLLIAMHLGEGDEWRARSRDNPGTWAAVPIDALKKMRTRGVWKGFRDEAERLQHQAALQRVLRLKLLWEAAAGREGSPTEVTPYWDYTERKENNMTTRYLIHPRWWFDVEMGQSKATAQFFQASLRSIIQIPPNKRTQKAIARFLVSSFWRMQATGGHGYKITLRELHDRAGIPMPELAQERPSQYARRFIEDIRQICDARSEIALIQMPDIILPSLRSGKGFQDFLRQQIDLVPHPDAPPEVHAAISHWEERGAVRRNIKIEAGIRAEERGLTKEKRAAKSRKKGELSQ